MARLFNDNSTLPNAGNVNTVPSAFFTGARKKNPDGTDPQDGPELPPAYRTALSDARNAVSGVQNAPAGLNDGNTPVTEFGQSEGLLAPGYDAARTARLAAGQRATEAASSGPFGRGGRYLQNLERETDVRQQVADTQRATLGFEEQKTDAQLKQEQALKGAELGLGAARLGIEAQTAQAGQGIQREEMQNRTGIANIEAKSRVDAADIRQPKGYIPIKTGGQYDLRTGSFTPEHLFLVDAREGRTYDQYGNPLVNPSGGSSGASGNFPRDANGNIQFTPEELAAGQSQYPSLASQGKNTRKKPGDPTDLLGGNEPDLNTYYGNPSLRNANGGQ